MPRPSNQKARSRAAQSGGGAVPRSPRSPSLRSGIDLAIRAELAARDEARIHMAAPVVELERVPRAELPAGQFGAEDVVCDVARPARAARPADRQAEERPWGEGGVRWWW